jgi:hypothetical protein
VKDGDSSNGEGADQAIPTIENVTLRETAKAVFTEGNGNSWTEDLANGSRSDRKLYFNVRRLPKQQTLQELYRKPAIATRQFCTVRPRKFLVKADVTFNIQEGASESSKKFRLKAIRRRAGGHSFQMVIEPGDILATINEPARGNLYRYLTHSLKSK